MYLHMEQLLGKVAQNLFFILLQFYYNFCLISYNFCATFFKSCFSKKSFSWEFYPKLPQLKAE